jgi:hypothetical protein
VHLHTVVEDAFEIWKWRRCLIGTGFVFVMACIYSCVNIGVHCTQGLHGKPQDARTRVHPRIRTCRTWRLWSEHLTKVPFLCVLSRQRIKFTSWSGENFGPVCLSL